MPSECDNCTVAPVCAWINDEVSRQKNLPNTREKPCAWKARPYNIGDLNKALDRKRKVVIRYESGVLYLDRMDVNQESGWDEREVPFDPCNAYDSVVELIAILEVMQGRE